MKAVVAIRFGGPDVLETREIADPHPRRGGVVVDVGVGDVLLVETEIRGGRADWFPASPPYVPGLGVAGHVRSGGHGVSDARLGLLIRKPRPPGSSRFGGM